MTDNSSPTNKSRTSRRASSSSSTKSSSEHRKKNNRRNQSRTNSKDDSQSVARGKVKKQSSREKDVSFFIKLNRFLTKVLLVVVLVLCFSIYKFIVAFQGIQDPDHSDRFIEAPSSTVDDAEYSSSDPYDDSNYQEDNSDDDYDDGNDHDGNDHDDDDDHDGNDHDGDDHDGNDDDDDHDGNDDGDDHDDSASSDIDSEDSSLEDGDDRTEHGEEDPSSDLSEDYMIPQIPPELPDPQPSVVTDALRYELEVSFTADIPSSDAFYYSQIPSYTQSMSIQGMYYTGIAYDLYQYSYELCDGRLFVTVTGDQTSESSTYREVYDIETGEHLGSYDIDEMLTLFTGCLEGGRSYVIGTDLSLKIYQQSGFLDQFMTFSALENVSRQSLSLITVTQDGDYLCVRQAGSPDFLFIRITDGSSFIMTIENAPSSLGLLENADDLVLTDYRHSILTIDPDNRTWKIRDIEAPFVHYANGLLYEAASKSFAVYDPDNDVCTFQSIWTHETILGAHGSLMVTALDRNGDYLNDSIHFYDFDRNEYREIIMPEGYGVYNALFPGSGRILLCYNHGNSDGFAFVELSDLTYEGSMDLNYSSIHCLEDETQSLVDRAYEQFGVSIFYGEQGDDFDLDDYRGTVCADGLRNYEAVLTVYNLLQKFPQGMLRECYEGFCDGLDLYLCADIRGLDGSGLSLAGGVSNYIGDRLILALDIFEPYTFNLPHELSHLFDYRIRQYYWEQDKELDDYWCSLSPEGAFIYTYSGYEDLDYYILGYADSDDVYFTRAYARTMPGEDRATIFETMFDHPEDDCSPILYHTHLREKAIAYAQLLRNVFPSCRTSGRLYWEIGLK